MTAELTLDTVETRQGCTSLIVVGEIDQSNVDEFGAVLAARAHPRSQRSQRTGGRQHAVGWLNTPCRDG